MERRVWMSGSVDRWEWHCGCGWTVGGPAPTVAAAAEAQRAALQAHARFCAWAAETARRAAAFRRARLRLWAAVEARLQAVGVPGNIRHRIGEWLVDTPQSWDLETVEAALEALCAEPWLPRGVGEGTRRRLLALAGVAGENGRWPTEG